MTAVKDTDELRIHEDITEVVNVLCAERTMIFGIDQSLVRHESETLSDALHVIRFHQLDFARNEHIDGDPIRQRDFPVRLDRNRFGHFADSLSRIEVLPNALRHLRKARIRPPLLADRRLIVVARHIRDERIAAARPSAKARSAMRHVERKAGAVR